MPIYDYEPTENKKNLCCFFEKIQSLSDPHLTQCPTCHGPVRRAVSSFAIGSSYESFAQSTNIKSKQVSQTAKDAAKLAAKHICSGGCCH